MDLHVTVVGIQILNKILHTALALSLIAHGNVEQALQRRKEQEQAERERQMKEHRERLVLQVLCVDDFCSVCAFRPHTWTHARTFS